MISLGITGTQEGPTDKQCAALLYLLTQLQDHTKYYHNGDCIGVDAFFFHLVRQAHPKGIIIGHPPDKSDKRAFCKFDIVRKPKPYLIRNQDIVNESDLMLVVPKEAEEQLRSGTWATYRYTKKANKPYIIVYPNGKYKKT